MHRTHVLLHTKLHNCLHVLIKYNREGLGSKILESFIRQRILSRNMCKPCVAYIWDFHILSPKGTEFVSVWLISHDDIQSFFSDEGEIQILTAQQW